MDLGDIDTVMWQQPMLPMGFAREVIGGRPMPCATVVDLRVRGEWVRAWSVSHRLDGSMRVVVEHEGRSWAVGVGEFGPGYVEALPDKSARMLQREVSMSGYEAMMGAAGQPGTGLCLWTLRGESGGEVGG